MQTSALERLEAEAVDGLVDRLTAFARRRLRGMYGQKLETAEDYVSRAILALAEETRAWPEDLGAYQFLCGVISSFISNDAAKKENLVTESLHRDQNAHIRSDSLSPLDSILNMESDETSRKYLNVILESVAHDRDMYKFLAFIIRSDDVPKPSSVATSLGVPVERVYNIRKRLKSHLKKFKTPEAV